MVGQNNKRLNSWLELKTIKLPSYEYAFDSLLQKTLDQEPLLNVGIEY